MFGHAFADTPQHHSKCALSLFDCAWGKEKIPELPQCNPNSADQGALIEEVQFPRKIANFPVP